MSIQVSVSWLDMDTQITPICSLEDPKTTTDWRRVEILQEILYYLAICNWQRFGQAACTSFTVPPLSQYFVWSKN
eukprot:13059585-Ditylum_brightwellii.AAC.1